MASFLFVHGLFLGGWCWERVLPQLRERGHHAAALDLAAHGRDRGSPAEVSMRSYVDGIRTALADAPARTILVSHSASGIWASQAAELSPELVERLVYVAAVIPQDGESLMDWVPRAPESMTVKHLDIDESSGSVSLAPDVVVEALFADCAPSDTHAAVARMRPSPLAPLSAPVKLTADRFGRIPRSYIRCERDRSIPPAAQDQVLGLSPCQSVRSLDTGHCPFYAAPEAFVEALLSAAMPSRSFGTTETTTSAGSA